MQDHDAQLSSEHDLEPETDNVPPDPDAPLDSKKIPIPMKIFGVL